MIRHPYENKTIFDYLLNIDFCFIGPECIYDMYFGLNLKIFCEKINLYSIPNIFNGYVIVFEERNKNCEYIFIKFKIRKPKRKIKSFKYIKLEKPKEEQRLDDYLENV